MLYELNSLYMINIITEHKIKKLNLKSYSYSLTVKAKSYLILDLDSFILKLTDILS